MVKYLFFFTTLISLYGSNISHTFYGGANLGLCVISGKRNDASESAGEQKNLTENKGVYKKGAFGGIFTGYLLQFKNFAIGPELFWNYLNLSDNIEGQQTVAGPAITTFDVRYRINNQYGVNLRFGTFIQTYFLYALCGLHWQQYNFQIKSKQADAVAGDLREYNYNASNKITQGNSFGFGLQKQLFQNYDIGFEYKLTNLPRKSYEFKLGDPSNTKLNSNASFKLHSFSVRFIFKI